MGAVVVLFVVLGLIALGVVATCGTLLTRYRKRAEDAEAELMKSVAERVKLREERDDLAKSVDLLTTVRNDYNEKLVLARQQLDTTRAELQQKLTAAEADLRASVAMLEETRRRGEQLDAARFVIANALEKSEEERKHLLEVIIELKREGFNPPAEPGEFQPESQAALPFVIEEALDDRFDDDSAFRATTVKEARKRLRRAARKGEGYDPEEAAKEVADWIRNGQDAAFFGV